MIVEPRSTGKKRGPRSGAWRSPPIPGSRLTALTAERLGGLRLAEGVPWRDLDALELNNFGPWSTIGAILGVPVAMVMLLSVKYVASVEPVLAEVEAPLTDFGLPDATTGDEATERSPNNPDDSSVEAPPLRRPTAVLLDDGEGRQAVSAVPLFTSSARRRDQLKVLFGGDLGVEGFVLGPRFGLKENLFASFLFAPSVLVSSNTGTVDHSRGRLMLCAELGFDL